MSSLYSAAIEGELKKKKEEEKSRRKQINSPENNLFTFQGARDLLL